MAHLTENYFGVLSEVTERELWAAGAGHGLDAWRYGRLPGPSLERVPQLLERWRASALWSKSLEQRMRLAKHELSRGVHRGDYHGTWRGPKPRPVRCCEACKQPLEGRRA